MPACTVSGPPAVDGLFREAPMHRTLHTAAVYLRHALQVLGTLLRAQQPHGLPGLLCLIGAQLLGCAEHMLKRREDRDSGGTGTNTAELPRLRKSE